MLLLPKPSCGMEVAALPCCMQCVMGRLLGRQGTGIRVRCSCTEEQLMLAGNVTSTLMSGVDYFALL